VSILKDKILLADDEKDLTRATKMILEFSGYDVDVAYNGQEALELAKENSYDCILLDIMMPNLNGEDTMKQLKEISDFKTPVIALTADAVAGAEQRYLDDGFTDYIAKPFTKAQIKEKLDSIFK
jgi:CheY-like chemotaxis protein